MAGQTSLKIPCMLGQLPPETATLTSRTRKAVGQPQTLYLAMQELALQNNRPTLGSGIPKLAPIHKRNRSKPQGHRASSTHPIIGLQTPHKAGPGKQSDRRLASPMSIKATYGIPRVYSLDQRSVLPRMHVDVPKDHSSKIGRCNQPAKYIGLKMKIRQRRRQRNMFKTKEQGKTPKGSTK